MPFLTLRDEFDKTIERTEYEQGTTLSRAAMDAYPDGFPGHTVVLMGPNGEIVEPLAFTNYVAEDGEDWTLILQPQGPAALGALIAPLSVALPGALGAAGITWATVVWGAISLIGMALLRPTVPDIGGDAYDWDDDRPQYLSGQTNQMKPGARVPDVFGTVRVWPDLIAEPYAIYSGDSQTLRELYVVSNGVCEVTVPRLSDEELSDLPSSGITVYQPGDGANWPVSFPIVKSNAFVGGIELPGPNETISNGESFELRTSSMFVDVEGFFEGWSDTDYFKLSGDSVSDANKNQLFRATSVSADGREIFITPNMPVVETITDGTLRIRRVLSVVESSPGVPQVLDAGSWQYTGGFGPYSLAEFSSPGFEGVLVDSDGTGEVAGTWKAAVYVTDSGIGSYITSRYWPNDEPSFERFYYMRFNEDGWNPGIPGAGFATNIFSVPGTSTGILFDVQFPSGLYFQAAGKSPKSRSVDVQMSWRLVGDTVWTDEVYTFTDLTRTPVKFTTQFDWPASGEYEVYFVRLSLFDEDTTDKIRMDAVELSAVRGIQDTSDLADDPLNVTLVEINLSTQNAAQVSGQRNFNVLAQRALPMWLLGTPDEIVPTNKVTDALIYTAIVDGNYDINNINSQALIDIQADLDAISTEQGEWNGIVDQTMTVEDQLKTLATPQRIMVFRRGTYLDFRRQDADEVPRMLINARTKVEPETKTMTFSLENQSDAIIARYMDASNNYKEASVQWPSGVTPMQPSEQTILGVTDRMVATRLAQYAWDRQYYDRDVLEVSIGEEGILLSPGDVIYVTDALKSEKPIEGEVTSITLPDVFTFDQIITEGTYRARLRDAYGELYADSVVTIAASGTRQTIPIWAGVDAPTMDRSQVGLLYSFTPVGDEGDAWLVTEAAPTRDGPVSVSCVNYEPLSYQSDDNVTPAQPPVKRRRI